MPTRKRPWLRALLIGLAALVMVYGIWTLFFHKTPKAKEPPPPSVTVVEARVADIALSFDYAGRLAGSREVEIRPRVGGIILKRAYTEGQFVKEGTVLFQIDPAPYRAALAQAQASFDQAEKDLNRAQGLRKDRALSPREFDQAQSLYGQSKAALDTAKINLAYTTVRAPISGYTSEEGFSEGSLVAADTSLLTRLTQLDPMYVEFAYPDTEATQQRNAVANGSMTLPPGKMLSAEIHLDDGSIYPEEGKINFTDSIVDQTTGTVRARAVIRNAHTRVLPGQFVRVVVKGFTQKQAIAVPEQAILQGPQGTFVYVVGEDGTAKMTPVTLGLLNRHRQLVAKGLKDGDRVVTEGMIKVKPDKPVTIDTGEKKEAAVDDKKPNDLQPDEKKDESKTDKKKSDGKEDESNDAKSADDKGVIDKPIPIKASAQKAN